jgi:hypothetical protein
MDVLALTKSVLVFPLALTVALHMIGMANTLRHALEKLTTQAMM